MKKIKTYTLLFMLMILTAFSVGCSSVEQQDEDNILYDFPPFILIEDTYYKDSYDESELPEGCKYIGVIQSTVPGTEMPTESFQANVDIEGAALYLKDNMLYVEFNDGYWAFEEYVEETE